MRTICGNHQLEHLRIGACQNVLMASSQNDIYGWRPWSEICSFFTSSLFYLFFVIFSSYFASSSFLAYKLFSFFKHCQAEAITAFLGDRLCVQFYCSYESVDWPTGEKPRLTVDAIPSDALLSRARVSNDTANRKAKLCAQLNYNYRHAYFRTIFFLQHLLFAMSENARNIWNFCRVMHTTLRIATAFVANSNQPTVILLDGQTIENRGHPAGASSMEFNSRSRFPCVIACMCGSMLGVKLKSEIFCAILLGMPLSGGRVAMSQRRFSQCDHILHCVICD